MGRLALARGKGPPVSSDTTPNAFTFTDLTGQTESTAVTGSPVTITGINASTSFSVTGGSVQINGTGSFVTSGSVVNNDTLTPKGTANASYLGTTNVVVTVGGVSDTFTITTRADPAGAPALVSPSGTWNGTAASGGTPPTDPTRTTAKPVLQWCQLDKDTFTGDYVIGAWADCHGGLDASGVQFWVEGTLYSVTTPTLYVDTDRRGYYRARYGYWITLRSSDFTGVSASGVARIYAKATPANGAMQARVIGADSNQPMELYPRTALNDSTYRVRADGAGGLYTTIKLAMAAAAAAGKKTPLIQIEQSGTYELEDGAWTAVTDNKGYLDIRCSTGVSATLGRASMPTAPTRSLWTWDPRWSWVRFGPGVTVDCRNFHTIKTATGAFPAYHGCIVTNSIGTRDTLYYFKGRHPGLTGIDAGGTNVNSRFMECDIYYQEGGQFSDRWYGNHVYKCIGGVRTGIKFVAWNYERETDCRFYTTDITCFTLTRAAGGATVEKSGTTLVLKVGATTVATYQLSDVPTDTYYNTDAIADDINANTSAGAAHGIVAVKTDNTRNSLAIWPLSPGVLTLSSTATNVQTKFDIHSEYYQVAGWMEQYVKENNAVVDCNLVDCFFSTAMLNFGADYDTAFVNFLALSRDDSVAASPFDLHSHVLMKNVAINGLLSYNSNSNDAYCEITQSIVGYLLSNESASAGVWSTYPVFTDCLIGIVGATGPVAGVTPNGTGSSGNTQLGSFAAHLALFTDPSTGNYLPTGTALAGKKTPVWAYDGLQQARASTAAITPWAETSTIPTWRVP